ncbi:hypothetical protein F183_A54770 (plasmid) [Bryobacterales bacterium F-183]|nr:hypothetical protein F183_A54770 [Bryobacterales bacterium F-183]
MKTNAVHLLRLEAAAELALATFLYQNTGGSWTVFALLFLLPDIAMLGYFAGPRYGAIAYNFAHTFVVPAILAVLFPSPLWLIWFAHIAFDRMVGYGLKLPTAFHHTHLNAPSTMNQA